MLMDTGQATELTHRRKVINSEFGSLVGKTIKLVRPLKPSECELFGWEFEHDLPFLVQFTDGTCIVPTCDPEANGSGHLLVEGVS
jgi:hypothetical protein